jgi:hypothetical protein
MNHQNQDRLQLYKMQIPGIDQSMAESMVESMELVESMVVESMGLVEVEVEQEHQKDHQKDRRNRRLQGTEMSYAQVLQAMRTFCVNLKVASSLEISPVPL